MSFILVVSMMIGYAGAIRFRQTPMFNSLFIIALYTPVMLTEYSILRTYQYQNMIWVVLHLARSKSVV